MLRTTSLICLTILPPWRRRDGNRDNDVGAANERNGQRYSEHHLQPVAVEHRWPAAPQRSAFGSVPHNVYFDATTGAPADIPGVNANTQRDAHVFDARDVRLYVSTFTRG
jgi:hypothetical protein